MYFKIALVLLIAGTAILPSINAEESESPGPEKSRKPHELESMIVTARPLDRVQSEIAQPTQILSGAELRSKTQSSIGETLNEELGTTGSFFGPASSRPIIRGQGGPRVQVLRGGISTLDASDVSPDHAVTVDPLLADQVEILRGSSTLLYGPGTIGGVVNVVQDRIPEFLPEQPINAKAFGLFNTVSDEWAGYIKADGKVGDFALHADGSRRKAEDYSSAEGTVQNSDIDTTSFAFGGSYVRDRGFIGLAVSRYENEYGVPGGEGEGEEEAGGVRIDMDQTRVDFKTELDNPFSGFQTVSVFGAYNDYEHQEIEPTGVVATRFENNAFQGRLELLHNPFYQWEGVLGLQGSARDLSATGEESFIPPTDTAEIGLFGIEERDWGRWRAELGARVDFVDHSPTEPNPSRDFTDFNLALGTIYRFSPDYYLGFNFSRSARAPNAEELYADGPHLAINAFQIGDPNLDSETSLNFDLNLNKDSGRVTGKVNLFYNRFDDYIFLQEQDANNDGEADRVDELLVLTSAQQGADFYGFEGEVAFGLVEGGYGDLGVFVWSDYVRGEFRGGGGNVPRMPPLRFGGGLGYNLQTWEAKFDVYRVDDQDDTAQLETPTPGYTMMNLDLGYQIPVANADVGFFFRATNLLDELALRSTSFIKEEAPLPGRAFRFALQASF